MVDKRVDAALARSEQARQAIVQKTPRHRSRCTQQTRGNDQKYRNTLEQTKTHHWQDWLEKAEDLDIWTAHRFTSSSGGDGGKTKIPVLKYKVGDTIALASDNCDKGHMLAKNFFPAKPPTDEVSRLVPLYPFSFVSSSRALIPIR